MTVGIAAIEAQATFWQRDAEVVGFGVLELLHDPYFGIGCSAVVGVVACLLGRVVAVLSNLCAVVNIEALSDEAGGSDELNLLGFLVAQRRRAFERVEVEFVESLFGD